MTTAPEPPVSIVTITFQLISAGREQHFRQCLESVHDQTYEHIEHIVVDGASTDGTVALLQEYADRGWIRFVSEPDTGIYDAMNKGVRMARGTYVAFLNSDDYYHDSRGVAASVKSLEARGADFSYAPARMINDAGVVLTDHPHCFPDLSSVFSIMPFCHQTMFTRRSVMLAEGLFDTRFKSAGDYDFVLRLCLKKYAGTFVKKVFTTFRCGGLSDVDREQSRREVARAYFKNYGALLPITERECEGIYCRSYDGISAGLAERLKEFAPSFNYAEYAARNTPLGRLKRTVNSRIRAWRAKICVALFYHER